MYHVAVLSYFISICASAGVKFGKWLAMRQIVLMLIMISRQTETLKGDLQDYKNEIKKISIHHLNF